MEALIYVIIILVFTGISIISKILGAQKGQEENSFSKLVDLLSTKPPPPVVKTMPPKIAPPKPIPPPSPAMSTKQREAMEGHTELMAERKPLIPDEESTGASIAETSPISDSKTESVQSYFSEELKSNRKFAIICHEILGKPKALED